jgi:hypothetical protein
MAGLEAMIASRKVQSPLGLEIGSGCSHAPSLPSAVVLTVKSFEPAIAGLPSTKNASNAAPTAASATSAVPKPGALIELLNDLLLSVEPP